ncbi:MAG: 30S ribosome-binding factor RbfA [Candidatus Pacebacteria bacterium]|nr:30S ribosome-binding factor RbfA [Candidatus Paceibacterota bacterium]
MEQRVEKINSLIQKELGSLILKEIDIYPGNLVTITRVECSGNLFEGKVFISVIPESNFEDILALLNRHIFFLQQRLNKKLRMRPVPRIQFLQEKKTIEAGRIEELLNKIRKESIEKEEEN